MFIDENAQQLCGNYCVVIHTDGTSEVKQLKAGEDVFNEAKGFIGCRFIDHFLIQPINKNVQLEVLVNDEGYMEWQHDPSKVNQLASFLYNGGKTPGHYILGDAVICLEGEGDEGGEFCGMTKWLAENINSANNELMEKAKELCPVPDKVPDPKVTITSYESNEDMIRAMRGDKTVEPTSVTVLGGSDAQKE